MNKNNCSNKKKIKGQRILKNGTIGGYVYYKNEKKWKWRFIGRINNKSGGYKTQIKENLKELHKMGFMNKYYKGKLKNLDSGVSENKIASNLQKRLNSKYNSNKLSKKKLKKKNLIEKTIKLLNEYKHEYLKKNNFIFKIPNPDQHGYINVYFPNINKTIKLKILNDKEPGNKMTVSVPKKENRTKYKIKVANKLNNKREMKIMTPFGEKLHLKIPSNKKGGEEYLYYSYKVRVPDDLVPGNQFYAIINNNTPILLNVTENKKSGDILEFVDPNITNNINISKKEKIKQLLELQGRKVSNKNINKISKNFSIGNIDEYIKELLELQSRKKKEKIKQLLELQGRKVSNRNINEISKNFSIGNIDEYIKELLELQSRKKKEKIKQLLELQGRKVSNRNINEISKNFSIGNIDEYIKDLLELQSRKKKEKIKQLLELQDRKVSNRNINEISKNFSIGNIDEYIKELLELQNRKASNINIPKKEKIIKSVAQQLDSNVSRIPQEGIYNPQNRNINQIRKLCKMDGYLIFTPEHIEYLLGLKTLKELQFGSLNQDKHKREILQEINKQLDNESRIKLRKLYDKMINVDYQTKRNNLAKINPKPFKFTGKISMKEDSYRNFYRYLIEMIKEQKISMCILNTFITYLITETSGDLKTNYEYQNNIKNLIKEIKNREIKEQREILKTF